MLRLHPAALLLLASPLAAQQSHRAATASAAGAPGYADVADLVLAAPVIADATIRSVARIKGAEAAGVAPGHVRYYVTADVAALIRGASGVPPRIGYLLDVAPDAGGRLPKLAKRRVVVFARSVAERPDQLQLVAPDAQLDWTPTLDARARAIAAAALAPDAPPRITGLGNAFHVPGALPGESETQVFLQTADARPISLSVLRRPGETPRWAVALGEVTDEAAAPPAAESLLWYRLACALPAVLPARSTATLSADDAAAAQTDYRLVIDQLGPCGRTRATAG